MTSLSREGQSETGATTHAKANVSIGRSFPPDVLHRAKQTRLCVFDVDGVLTDGKIFLGPKNLELKAFDVKDGQGIVMLREFVDIAVITGRRSEAVSDRMSQLGIRHVVQGEKNKLGALKKILGTLELDLEAVCYVGDDLPDLAVMKRVGLAVAVADATSAVHNVAHYSTICAGGHGAAREVCELILTAQNRLEDLIKKAANAEVAVDQNV